jgi:hypothetical protein
MMQCQRNVRHNHRTRTTQFDLFAAPGGEAVRRVIGNSEDLKPFSKAPWPA